jgi:hypothetical protein
MVRLASQYRLEPWRCALVSYSQGHPGGLSKGVPGATWAVLPDTTPNSYLYSYRRTSTYAATALAGTCY